MKHKWLILSLIIISNIAQAYKKSDGEYIAQFMVAIKKHKNMMGTFSQQIMRTKRKTYPKITGTFKVQKPNKFIWKYSGKNAHKIISTGRRVWLIQPDLKQVSHVSIETAKQTTPAVILFAPGDIAKTFKIIPRKRRTTAGLDWVELVARKRGNMQFERLYVGMKKNTIRRIVVKDSFGRNTVIKLNNVRTNVRFSPRTFVYSPPSMFDVLN